MARFIFFSLAMFFCLSTVMGRVYFRDPRRSRPQQHSAASAQASAAARVSNSGGRHSSVASAQASAEANTFSNGGGRHSSDASAQASAAGRVSSHNGGRQSSVANAQASARASTFSNGGGRHSSDASAQASAEGHVSSHNGGSQSSVANAQASAKGRVSSIGGGQQCAIQCNAILPNCYCYYDRNCAGTVCRWQDTIHPSVHGVNSVLPHGHNNRRNRFSRGCRSCNNRNNCGHNETCQLDNRCGYYVCVPINVRRKYW